MWGILLHSTQGTPQGDLRTLSKSRNVSAHFLVLPNGDIHQLVPLSRIAYHAGRGRLAGHAGNLNGGLIGIEVSNASKPWRSVPYPKAQLESVDRLIKIIDRRLGRRVPVFGHKEMIRYPGGWRKTDPNGDFPLKAFKRYRRHAAVATRTKKARAGSAVNSVPTSPTAAATETAHAKETSTSATVRQPRTRLQPKSETYLEIGPMVTQDELIGAWNSIVDAQQRDGVPAFAPQQRQILKKGDRYISRIGPLDVYRAAYNLLRARRLLPEDKLRLVRFTRLVPAAPKAPPVPLTPARETTHNALWYE